MKVFQYFAVILACVVFSFPLTSQSGPDAANTPIGLIAKVQGTVISKGKHSKRPMEENDPVYLGTHIETMEEARVLVVFIDDTQLTLGEKADLIIDEYVFDPFDSEENVAGISVSQGAFQWISGMISKRETPQVDIQTPSGSIGIRGTQFWAGEIGQGYGSFVTDGRIGFEGEWGEADLFAGDGIYISPEVPEGTDNQYWNRQNKAIAEEKVAFKDLSSESLSGRVDKLRRENVQRRLDYRRKMFPYKPDPSIEELQLNEDGFFTEEFEDFRDSTR